MQPHISFSKAKVIFLVAALSLILVLFVYGAVQHVLRTEANDPQIQMAEDAAGALAQGGSPSAVAGGAKVDISKSLAPFLVVFDKEGNPVASSGTLDGKLPTVPKGVLDAAKADGENRVTWQPESGVRIAAVVTVYSASTTGFVLAGRSMREQENRDADVFHLALVAWVIIVAAGAIGAQLLYPKG